MEAPKQNKKVSKNSQFLSHQFCEQNSTQNLLLSIEQNADSTVLFCLISLHDQTHTSLETTACSIVVDMSRNGLNWVSSAIYPRFPLQYILCENFKHLRLFRQCYDLGQGCQTGWMPAGCIMHRPLPPSSTKAKNVMIRHETSCDRIGYEARSLGSKSLLLPQSLRCGPQIPSEVITKG